MAADSAKPWFVPKRYGYGAVPASWEGWAVIAVFLAADAALAWFVLIRPATAGQGVSFGRVAAFLAAVAVLVVLLILVCKAKTHEEWRWRSGEDR